MQSKVFTSSDFELQRPILRNEKESIAFLKDIEETSDYSLNGRGVSDNIIE